jgi:porin
MSNSKLVRSSFLATALLIMLIAMSIVVMSSPDAFAESAELDEDASLWEFPDYTGDLQTRPALTGDWGGQRAKLSDKGIVVSLDSLLTYQGVVDGGRDTDEDYTSSFDLEIHMDLQKMGLWEGGFVRVFAEGKFGDGVNSDVGTLTAANTDGLFPLPGEDELTLTAVEYIQFLSESFAVIVGKMDTLDGDTNDFAGARGKDQFLNSNFVFNPATLRTTPYSALGAGALFLLPEEKGILSLAALDANGEPNTSGFSDAFDDGTILSAELRVDVKPHDLPGHQLVGMTWSSKDYAILDQNLRLLLLEWILTGSVTPEENDDSWSFYYNFDQYVYIEDEDPTQGVGLFGRLGWADEDTSPIKAFYSIGVGGKGIIPGRDNDTFGIGYYYVESSDEFPDLLGLIDIDDGQGFEVFYNIEVTPWLHVTPDFQIIEPAVDNFDTAYVLGIRTKVDF